MSTPASVPVPDARVPGSGAYDITIAVVQLTADLDTSGRAMVWLGGDFQDSAELRRHLRQTIGALSGIVPVSPDTAQWPTDRYLAGDPLVFEWQRRTRGPVPTATNQDVLRTLTGALDAYRVVRGLAGVLQVVTAEADQRPQFLPPHMTVSPLRYVGDELVLTVSTNFQLLPAGTTGGRIERAALEGENQHLLPVVVRSVWAAIQPDVSTTRDVNALGIAANTITLYLPVAGGGGHAFIVRSLQAAFYELLGRRAPVTMQAAVVSGGPASA